MPPESYSQLATTNSRWRLSASVQVHPVTARGEPRIRYETVWVGACTHEGRPCDKAQSSDARAVEAARGCAEELWGVCWD